MKAEILQLPVSPDLIAITELMPKNYSRDLKTSDYKLDGYHFEEVNLDDRGSTRGVAVYFRKSLDCSVFETNKFMKIEDAPSEVISVELKLDGNEKMLLSIIYRSPNSESRENRKE